MKIVLVGPRGSGKTSVGKELSSIIDCPFVDADVEFDKKYGSIVDFVKRNGWEEFRKAESDLISDMCRREYSRVVFAPGGGAVAHNQGDIYRDRNALTLQDFGTIFYLLPSINLEESAQILAGRVLSDSSSSQSRPSLTGSSNELNEMRSVLFQRNPFYLTVSHHVLYTVYKEPSEIARDVLKIYNGKN